ncbi:MAG TPA: molybdopterin-dependent oxidoreductase [Acidimicrobiales bacterium]|nr:molybdopterin-dependent oxidoreductase [Acidimicrobiales bacterium]
MGTSEPLAAASAGTPIGRRVVLGMLGLGAVGIVAGGRVQDALNRFLQPIEAADPTGLSQLIPAAGGFRIYSITGSLPFERPSDYTLTIDGMVQNRLTLSLADLKSLPATSLVKDFQCVTGWRVPMVHWTGVQLSALLDQAGVLAGGNALTFDSFDGAYTESLTISQARRPDVLVAYEMLGAPVTRQHGGPVRMYVAPMYGYKSCKWLSRITVVNKVVPGYWENLGYDVDGWVGKSNGRSDAPTA